jgi:hypothetical protein
MLLQAMVHTCRCVQTSFNSRLGEYY